MKPDFNWFDGGILWKRGKAKTYDIKQKKSFKFLQQIIKIEEWLEMFKSCRSCKKIQNWAMLQNVDLKER